jgi:hypothetical protein
MGDVTDIAAYRKKIEELVEKEDDGGGDIKCLKCKDTLFFVSLVPEYTDLDEGGPYALICQHCYEPLGSAYIFNEEDLEET